MQDELYLRGTFNDWQAQSVFKFLPMVDETYRLRVSLPKGTHECKVADSGWEKDYGVEKQVTLVTKGKAYDLIRKGENIRVSLDSSEWYFVFDARKSTLKILEVSQVQGKVALNEVKETPATPELNSPPHTRPSSEPLNKTERILASTKKETAQPSTATQATAATKANSSKKRLGDHALSEQLKETRQFKELLPAAPIESERLRKLNILAQKVQQMIDKGVNSTEQAHNLISQVSFELAGRVDAFDIPIQKIKETHDKAKSRLYETLIKINHILTNLIIEWTHSKDDSKRKM
ncbi:hypothetical protein WDW89_08910 [Deltaproteobacteria bacterium TL4]